MKSFPQPKRSLGQNYLVDVSVQKRILSAFQNHWESEVVCEIGPGPGTLTEGLSRLVPELHLVEKDRRQVEVLKEIFIHNRNIHIHNADFLDFDLSSFSQKIFAIGNLPYNAASPILIRVLENHKKFSGMIFMFQKEVAQRIVAAPQSEHYSVLSVWSRVCTEAQILFDVSPDSFRPRPKIISSVVYFSMREKVPEDLMSFMAFVRRIFMTRRKKIATTLRQQFDFDVRTKNISSDILSLTEKRPEELDEFDLRKLFDVSINLNR